MVLACKKENPITIDIETQTIVLSEERLPLNPGCMFGGSRYGFKIVNNESEEYGTQCPIIGICISHDLESQSFIAIYEEGKYLPWKFTMDGELLSPAIFLPQSRKDLQYLQEKYSQVAVSDLERINNEMLEIVEKQKKI